MDIIVTIPKTEANNTVREDQFVADSVREGSQVVQFWKVGRKPKALNVGDKVFFVENGRVSCYHEFIGFASDPVCQVTNRVWPGLNLVLRCPAVPLKNYIPHVGFQGFRYVNDPRYV